MKRITKKKKVTQKHKASMRLKAKRIYHCESASPPATASQSPPNTRQYQFAEDLEQESTRGTGWGERQWYEGRARPVSPHHHYHIPLGMSQPVTLVMIIVKRRG